MADFSASRLVGALGRRCATETLSAYNLGNVANSYAAFEAVLDKLPLPKILVLEFSPHVVLGHAPPERLNEGMFQRYRSLIREFELLLAGRLRQVLLLEDPLVINGDALRTAVEQARTGKTDLQHLYYAMRSAHGYGQRLQPDGQVYYRSYLPDRRAAGKLTGASSEYGAFESIHLAGSLDPDALSALERIVQRFRADRQLVIVRPPVSGEIYELENRMQRDAIDRVTAFLSRLGVPYVDMNPSPYQFTDLSHIDWYDTAEATASLAQRLDRAVEWNRFQPEGRPCPAERS
jgi:hypothetical protein